MRAFSRTLTSVIALTAVAAGSVACSGTESGEPSLTAMSTIAKEADETPADSAEPEADKDSAKEDKEPAEDASAESKSDSKPDSNKSDSDSGYSYDRVKDNEGYITNVGLGEAGKKASYPACDGRYILIVDSVIADGGDSDTFSKLAQSVLMGEPSPREFTVPGQCGSLRKSVHGADIYPVYVDYGSDKAAACRAKATYGGNVRPLIDDAFPDASSSDVDEARLALDPC